MATCTYSCLLNVINLGNSIIGVSILAMPYCFQKCGILLSVLLIFLSGILVRISCYLLLKGAIMARRRNFEFLAFHAFGSTGKLFVEIGVIGFLIGVCIAFFVVIGDLGPPLASQYLMIENTPHLRAEVLVFLGLFVALPLGLLRKVDSLTSLSALSIAFYGCLVLKIFSEAISNLILNEWWHKVNWWKPDGLLPCLPIFSMALYCQTQLFEFFDTLVEPSIKRMTSVVSGAVYLCSSVYIAVGVFGYIACHDQIITGNILINLTPSTMTEFIKVGFIMTVAISFPLCLFPCRTSLHSLLFKQGLGHHDSAVNFIPDHRFRLLTISLVMITIGIAVMIPNIEFILGIIGSTIGTAICLIFPAVIFVHDTNKNTTEKRMAQVVMFVGFFILIACTYSTLNERSHAQHRDPKEILVLPKLKFTDSHSMAITAAVTAIPVIIVPDNARHKEVISKEEHHIDVKVEIKKEVVNEKRHEPPIPREPDSKIVAVNGKNDDIDPQALQKEDKELQKDITKSPLPPVVSVDNSLKEKQEQLLKKLEEQHKEQKKIIEEQKNILEELKLHKEIHNEIAKEETIEKVSKLPAVKKGFIVPVKDSIAVQSRISQNIPEVPKAFSETKIVKVIVSPQVNPENKIQVNVLPLLKTESVVNYPKISPDLPVVPRPSPLTILTNVKQASFVNETEVSEKKKLVMALQTKDNIKIPVSDLKYNIDNNNEQIVIKTDQVVNQEVKIPPLWETLKSNSEKKTGDVQQPNVITQESKVSADNQSIGIQPDEKHEMR